MKNKNLRRILLGLGIFLLCACVVYAALNFNVGSHVKVVEDTPPGDEIDLEFYADSDCTVPLDFVEWGNMTRNQQQTKVMFYTKNIGTVPVTVSGSTSGLMSSQFTLEFDIDDDTLNVGESTEVSGTLRVKPSAPLGDKNFTIVITGS